MIAKQHQVEIPEIYLLILAVYGNMGDGQIPKFMQDWATRECLRLGLHDKLEKERQERYQELKQRVANVIGAQAIEQIENEALKVSEILKDRLKS